MADIKYLSLDGLSRTVANIRLKFATELKSSVNESSYSISLLNGIPTSTTTPTKTALSTVVINAVTATNAGLMLPGQKSTLEDLTSNAVKTINSGTGITVTKSGTTATVSLNTANTTTIGGIKVGKVNTAASGANTDANGNKYAVHIDKDGLGYVDLPTWSNKQGTITGVTAGDGLTGGGTSGSVSLAVNPGTGITINGDKVTLITASNNQLGGISTGYITSTANKNYAVKVDKSGNAYVNVDWKNDNTLLTKVDYTANAETDSTANTITVVTEVGDATGTTGSSVSGTYTTQNVYTKTYVDAVKTRVGNIETTLSGLSNAMRYIGKSSTTISDGGTQNPTIGGTKITPKQGDVVIDTNNKKEYIWNGSNWEEFGNEGNYKPKQVAVPDPTASGNSTTFIDSISQDEEGKITVSKKNVSFPAETKLTTDTTTDAASATVVGKITVSNHTITAHTKTIAADNTTIVITTSTAGRIGIKANYTPSAPITITATNTIGLSWVAGSSSTMLKSSGTTAATFADTDVSTATIVTHNKLGLQNNALCAEIDTITAYEIDALFR